MVALPQYTPEVVTPDLKIVRKAEQSGRMTNTSYGVFFVDEGRNSFDVSISFNAFNNGANIAYHEVSIPKALMTKQELQSFLMIEAFARQITSEGGINALSAESLGDKMLGSIES